MTEWYMVDVRFLAGFLALSFAAAFAVARFIRAGQGPRVSWSEVTSTQPDLGPHVLGASEADARAAAGDWGQCVCRKCQRLAVAEVDEQCRAALERGRDGCP